MEERKVWRNSAGRLFALLELVKSNLSTQQSVAMCWVTAAGPYNGSSRSDAEHSAVKIVKAVEAEVPRISSSLRELGVPSFLYESHLGRLKAATNIAYLHQNKDTTKQFLTEALAMTLQWCAFTLPDDPVAPSDEALNELRQRIADLDMALQSKEIPPALRQFAESQLAALMDALMLYSVLGVAPLRAAVRKAVSDAHFEEAELKAEVEAHATVAEVQQVRQTLGGALKSAANIAGDAEKLAKAAGYFVGKAQEGAVFLLDFATKL